LPSDCRGRAFRAERAARVTSSKMECAHSNEVSGGGGITGYMRAAVGKILVVLWEPM
jgi:hypothetical protein